MSKIKQRIVSMLTVLAMAAAILVATAAPANATVYWNCPSGHGCVWMDANGSYHKIDIAFSVAQPNVCYNLTGAWNDAVSSASSDYGSGWDLMLFWDANCGDSSWDFAVISSRSVSFTGLKSWFNDEASSYMIAMIS